VDAHEVDIRHQKEIGIAYREIADVRGEVKELRTALVGLDGDNGLRGELREFMAQMGVRMSSQDGMLKIISDTIGKHDAFQGAVESRFENYMKFERIATCHGKSALNNYLASLEADNVEIKKERIAMTRAVIVATIGSGGALITALLVALLK
jgi:hypothetical protein